MAALDWLQQLLGGGQYGDPSTPAMPTSPLEGNLYTGGALGQAGLPADGAKGYTADALQHLKDVIGGKVAAGGALAQNNYDPNRSFAANALNPAGIEQATDVAFGIAPGAIRAYHGSPHSFDRFDLSKIGTGEGAQAYGHGLYFAEHEPVAKGYRDALASQTFKTPGGMIFDPQSQLQHLNVRATAHNNGPDLDATIRRAEELLTRASDQTAPMLKHDIQVLQSFKEAGGVSRNPGHMYEVNIHADPKSFLDWDRPLGAQVAPVQEAMKSGLTDLNFTIPDEVAQLPNGRWAPMAEGKVYGRHDGWPDRQTAQYVMQAAQQEAEKNAGLTAGDILSRTYGGQNMEAKSAVLRDAGIPGIRYLDQGSRGAGEGTSNYAVFDDKLIEILRKYGILPPLAAGGLLGAAEE